MVGKGAKIWGQKFRSSKQAIIESSPKHSSKPLLVATLVIMNWVSNVQAWGPMFFIVVDVYKSKDKYWSTLCGKFLLDTLWLCQQSSHEYH